MDNGRNRGKFSEGGRMGFEPVENVGLAAKESAQEILKIFNQVHEPRVVHSPSQASTQWVAQAYLSYRSAECAWVGVAARTPAPARSASPSSLLAGATFCKYSNSITPRFHNIGGQLNANSALQQTSGRCTKERQEFAREGLVLNYTDPTSPYSFPP